MSKLESEAVWPFDGVGGHRERFRWCQLSVPNSGGSPLRHEEEREGSIVLVFYQTDGNYVWTSISMASYWM